MKTPPNARRRPVMVKNYRYTVVYIDGVPFYTIETTRTRTK